MGSRQLLRQARHVCGDVRRAGAVVEFHRRLYRLSVVCHGRFHWARFIRRGLVSKRRGAADPGLAAGRCGHRRICGRVGLCDFAGQGPLLRGRVDLGGGGIAADRVVLVRLDRRRRRPQRENSARRRGLCGPRVPVCHAGGDDRDLRCDGVGRAQPLWLRLESHQAERGRGQHGGCQRQRVQNRRVHTLCRVLRHHRRGLRVVDCLHRAGGCVLNTDHAQGAGDGAVGRRRHDLRPGARCLGVRDPRRIDLGAVSRSQSGDFGTHDCRADFLFAGWVAAH